MSSPRIPNQRSQYNKLNERLAKYVLAIQSIYEELNRQASKIVLTTDYDGSDHFRFSDYPHIKRKVEQLQEDFVRDIGALIMRGTSDEWKKSNLIQDMLVDKVLQAYTGQKNRDGFTHYYQTNSPQLKAFQQRREKGMNLSDNLWNQSEEYKTELESAISCAIEKGTDAVTLSKRVSKYLDDYPSLQADYKERFGTATDAHDCEYRSIRLARSEINMAYRTAEQERWKQLDFVVGYEIKLSGSHPQEDICDKLAGKYPKDFVWTGWHPNDLCYSIPILKTEEEFFNDDVDKESVNSVKDVPLTFYQWQRDNLQRAKSWSSTPYFIRDNDKYIREDFKIGVYTDEERKFVRKGRTTIAMNRIEYYQKYFPELREVECAAINAYTQAVVKGNKNATSREINRVLRAGREDEYVSVASRLISQGLAKLPDYSGIVYRGETMSAVKFEDLYYKHLGDVVAFNGFTSASSDMDIAMRFVSHDGVRTSHKRIVFTIQGKRCKDISGISEFNGIFADENQHEYLFDNGCKFLVSKDVIERDGIIYMTLIEQ